GDSPTPQTKFCGLTFLIASYAAASARPQIAADWFVPPEFHCGLTNRGWLHSFMTMNWCTAGKVCAIVAAHWANWLIRAVLPHESGSFDGAHFAPPVKTWEWSG